MTPEGNSGARDPERIRAEIETTRAELGETVAALTAKADVKAQARRKVGETRVRVQEKVAEAREASPAVAKENPIPTAAIAALLAGFLLGWLIARRG